MTRLPLLCHDSFSTYGPYGIDQYPTKCHHLQGSNPDPFDPSSECYLGTISFDEEFSLHLDICSYFLGSCQCCSAVTSDVTDFVHILC